MAVQAGVSIAQMVFADSAGDYADEIGAALGVGATLGVILPYSRKHELEADRLGVDLMRKAGKDPAAAIRFWERMIANSQNQPKPPEVISTHPADQRRLEALQAAVNGAPA